MLHTGQSLPQPKGNSLIEELKPPPYWHWSSFGSLLPQPQNFLFFASTFFFKFYLVKKPKNLLRYARLSIIAFYEVFRLGREKKMNDKTNSKDIKF
jgi:hypothetical protein